mgnify:CR=1 FL=1|jgi:hypothetical protein
MPVLKSYKNADGHYILASVRGSLITFQLTTRGYDRLSEIGIKDGARFHLGLLADLTREGDAYTGGRGNTYHEAEQFEFTFDTAESKESEAMFPACKVTGRFDDLHLVAFKAEEQLGAQLLAPEAVSSLNGSIQLSMPITLLNLAAIDWLESSGHLPEASEVSQALRDWFRKEASAEWDRLRKSRNTGRQQALGLDTPDELELH